MSDVGKTLRDVDSDDSDTVSSEELDNFVADNDD